MNDSLATPQLCAAFSGLSITLLMGQAFHEKQGKHIKKTGPAASSASQDWLKDGSFRNKEV